MEEGGSPIEIDGWCETQLRLLQMEREAEVAEKERRLESKGIGELVAKGVALVRLQVDDISTGLGGRALVKLLPQHAVHGLSAHKFTPGDIVALKPEKQSGASTSEGIVYRASEHHVVVAFEEVPEHLDAPLSLTMLANNITFQRRQDVITNLRKNVSGATRMVNILFHGLPPVQSPPFGSEEVLFETSLGPFHSTIL